MSLTRKTTDMGFEALAAIPPDGQLTSFSMEERRLFGIVYYREVSTTVQLGSRAIAGLEVGVIANQ